MATNVEEQSQDKRLAIDGATLTSLQLATKYMSKVLTFLFTPQSQKNGVTGFNIFSDSEWPQNSTREMKGVPSTYQYIQWVTKEMKSCSCVVLMAPTERNTKV